MRFLTILIDEYLMEALDDLPDYILVIPIKRQRKHLATIQHYSWDTRAIETALRNAGAIFYPGIVIDIDPNYIIAHQPFPLWTDVTDAILTRDGRGLVSKERMTPQGILTYLRARNKIRYRHASTRLEPGYNGHDLVGEHTPSTLLTGPRKLIG